jgi:hypothetical protein
MLNPEAHKKNTEPQPCFFISGSCGSDRYSFAVRLKSQQNLFLSLSCRLLGIGRNQYIDLMNQTRSKTKFGGFSTSLFRKSYRDLLPARPVSDLVFLPWWVVQVIGWIY